MDQGTGILLFLAGISLLPVIANIATAGFGIFLLFRRRWLFACLCLGFSALSSFGPVVMSRMELARTLADIEAHSFWPDAVEFRGRSILFVSGGPGSGGCDSLCETLIPRLNGAAHFETVGRGRAAVSEIAELLAGNEAESELEVRMLSDGEVQTFDTVRDSIDMVVVVAGALITSAQEANQLALPEVFDGRPTWALYIFEGPDLWAGNSPVVRMLAVNQALHDGVGAVSSRTTLRPEGCASYITAFETWVGGAPLWRRSRFNCQDIFG